MCFYFFSFQWIHQILPSVPLKELQLQNQIIFGFKFVHQIVSLPLTNVNIFTSNSHPFIIVDNIIFVLVMASVSVLTELVQLLVAAL